MDDVVYRAARGAADSEGFARIHGARRKADGIVEGLRFETFPSAADLARELDGSDPRDGTVAEVGGQVATEGEFRAYFEGERADPSLWTVAWRGSRVAGAVMCRVSNGVGEPYEVSVAHAHRRRGLARALLTRGLALLESRGARAVRILTRREFPTQVWRLYESLGFRGMKEFPRWRKAMTP